MPLRSNPSGGTKRFIFFAKDKEEDRTEGSDQAYQNISQDILDQLLLAVGRESLREKTPTLEELEQALQAIIASLGNLEERDSIHGSSSMREPSEKPRRSKKEEDNKDQSSSSGMPIIKLLMQKGYLKDSHKWLSTKGFTEIGVRILSDVMKALKTGELGLHDTKEVGSGSILLETTRRFEPGDDVRLINVPKSLLNTIQRISSQTARQIGEYGTKLNVKINVPLEVQVDDFEKFETLQDVRVAVVYCIDLSSTMRYSSMYGDMSRIEAAKRAIWSLYLLNRKFFPSDSIYIVGFGALASKVLPQDIPYLKTFEPGSDFLHYTNYQAAFRLASKILQKDGALNRRMVLVTDGHPSACFIDNKGEQEKILSQRPYSHFYTPDKGTMETLKHTQNMNLDISSGELVYLCYRYRQVDQYIGERTIVEAKKCRSMGIDIDTIMISEEDSLLGYVNELEKYVKGRSYYINPAEIDKVLVTDYLANKRQKTISSHS